jgi:hypothetical protein
MLGRVRVREQKRNDYDRNGNLPVSQRDVHLTKGKALEKLRGFHVHRKDVLSNLLAKQGDCLSLVFYKHSVASQIKRF